MKYAILEAGGKQYIAKEGETIDIDRLPKGVGEKVQWKDVLMMVEDKKVAVGTPFVKGASVKGKILDQIKAPKVHVFKYKTRERYRRRHGHRQKYTRVLIDKISVAAPRKKVAEAESKVPKGSTRKASAAEEKAPAKAKKTETK